MKESVARWSGIVSKTNCPISMAVSRFLSPRRLFETLSNPRVAQFILEACILISLVSVTVGERSIIAAQRRIMPAGDVFNFQSIARNIRHFDYPIREKRLPGFPLVLLAGLELGFDLTHTGIAVSIISSGATTAILYLLGRRLRFPALPLALCLLLTSVSPLLTINGVRPLSDSFFLFLIVLAVYLTTIVRPTRRSALLVGMVLMFLAFTRYEGVPTALLMLLLLRLRIPWRLVLIAALPLFVAGLLWLPVAKKVHGSIRDFGYFRDAQEIADTSKIPTEYLRVVKAAGFGRAWQIQDLWATETEARTDAEALIHSPMWWFSVLANFGVIWLIFKVRKAAAPLLIEFAYYPILPAWWFLYSRYVAPMNAFYFFAAAAGASGIWILTKRLFRNSGATVRFAAAGLLTVLLINIMIGVVPGQYKEAQARGFENNGNGYALYQALMSLRDTADRVAVSADYLMAYMMLGSVLYEKDGLNNERGLYLSAKPSATPVELADYLKENRIDVLIDNGEKDVLPLVAYLRQIGVVDHTKTFAWPRQDKDIDTTRVHYLTWHD